MITATITRTVPVHRLRPGDHLATGHTVDSIELAATGATALCFPPGRTDGRRIRVPLGAIGHSVDIAAASPEEIAKAHHDLISVIAAGSRALDTAEMDSGYHVAHDDGWLTVILPSEWKLALHADESTGDDRTPDLEDEETA